MYGENSAALRSALTTLLQQHRIQQRIGGAGIHTVPMSTTTEQREEIGQLIQRYRCGVLTWCHQALIAADPTLHGADASDFELDLRRRLDTSRRASTASLPTLADLTAPHEFALVDAWRRAGKAAALGEHDLTGEIAHGHLSLEECLTVIKDAAEIIRGLVVLDRRYTNIPGWERLKGREGLQRAADGCAFINASDYSVDRRGWRPRATTIRGPARPGIGGVIQAEHNLLIHLKDLPTALNLRLILDSQREISHLLAARVAVTAPEFARASTKRSQTYAAIHREARNIGGPIGSGGAAVAEAATAVNRLRRLPATSPLTEQAAADLDTLLLRVDGHVADLIERGARERLYFPRTRLPRIVENDGNLIHGVRERFIPFSTPTTSDLIRFARELRQPTPTPHPPAAARTSRLEFEAAIRHRPTPRPDPGMAL